MDSLVSYLQVSGEQIFGPTGWLVIWNVFKIGLVILPILGAVAYATLYERKLIGWMHARLGPNRVGPIGLLQPIADSLKLMSKEIIIPEKGGRYG